MKRSVNLRRRGAGARGLLDTMKFVGMTEAEQRSTLEAVPRVKSRLEKLREEADGYEIYQCHDCSTYWIHSGDFACTSCGSKRADEVPMEGLER